MRNSFVTLIEAFYHTCQMSYDLVSYVSNDLRFITLYRFMFINGACVKPETIDLNNVLIAVNYFTILIVIVHSLLRSPNLFSWYLFQQPCPLSQDIWICYQQYNSCSLVLESKFSEFVVFIYEWCTAQIYLVCFESSVSNNLSAIGVFQVLFFSRFALHKH